ncbi:MAG: acyltransferase [Clostridiales bacterium]|nr:acyltransferase [Clostridiales bacterium]
MEKHKEGVRKHYIDNLRNLTILLLFPMHTLMLRNDFGQGTYIDIFNTLIALVNPWFMPILFVLAGMSARYTLEKRGGKEFVIQRLNKLLIPLIGQTILLVPFQTLYARKFFEHYQGGLVEHWKYFFTHFTDFHGYDGAFTIGHLWFILYLLIISMLALPIFYLKPYEKLSASVEKLSVFGVLLLFLPIWMMYYVCNFCGYSIGKSFALYIIGYYVLSNRLILEKMERNIGWLAGLCVVGTAVSAAMYYKFSYYGDLWVNFIGWLSILALLAGGKLFLNRETGFTRYFNQASYPIYLLHFSILVALGYYIVQMSDSLLVQVFCACVGSFLFTVLAYELLRLIPIVRKVAGIK